MNIGNMAKSMNDVERYSPISVGDSHCPCADMDTDPDGEWVPYAAYAALQQQLAALQEERDELSSNLGMAMQAVENLQQQLAAAREALQAAERDELQAIREREAAEDALGRMFHAVTGRIAEWSSEWDFEDAIEEVVDHGYDFAQKIHAQMQDLENVARAWRNRFIDERMNAYPDEGYEMRRCHAESDANEFIDAFHATLQRDRQP